MTLFDPEEKIQWSDALPKVDSKFWAVWNCKFNPRNQLQTEKLENPVYLKNCRDAAAYFVDQYLFSDGPRKITYREMLLQMHVLLAKDLTSVPHGSYDVQAWHPDLFRHEVQKVDKPTANFDYETNPFPRAFEDAKARKSGDVLSIEVTFPAGLIGSSPSYTFDFTAKLLPDGKSYGFDLDIVEPPVGRVVEVAGPHELKCNVMPLREMDRIFAEGEKLLELVIRHDPQGEPGEEKARELVKLVARYYQLMVICHPFMSQNASLITNQVNCVLFYFLGKFVTHTAELDMAAYAMPSAQFENYFLFVLENLPRVPLPRNAVKAYAG